MKYHFWNIPNQQCRSSQLQQNWNPDWSHCDKLLEKWSQTLQHTDWFDKPTRKDRQPLGQNWTELHVENTDFQFPVTSVVTSYSFQTQELQLAFSNTQNPRKHRDFIQPYSHSERFCISCLPFALLALLTVTQVRLSSTCSWKGRGIWNILKSLYTAVNLILLVIDNRHESRWIVFLHL